MITPTEADIGRRVKYQRIEMSAPDFGYITSFTEMNVRVRYDGQHPQAPGQSTNPEDLEFAD